MTLQIANSADVGNISLSLQTQNYWETKFGPQIVEYWTFESSLIWPNIYELFLPEPFSLHMILSVCLWSRTCWTLMTHWTSMQQNIIWETRWGFSTLTISDALRAILTWSSILFYHQSRLSLTSRWFTCAASSDCLRCDYSLHNHIHTLASVESQKGECIWTWCTAVTQTTFSSAAFHVCNICVCRLNHVI